MAPLDNKEVQSCKVQEKSIFRIEVQKDLILQLSHDVIKSKIFILVKFYVNFLSSLLAVSNV